MMADTTLSILFGFLLAAGGGFWKAYQWYVTHKETQKDWQAKETLRKKNREINTLKKLYKTLERDCGDREAENKALRNENQRLHEQLTSAPAGRIEE